MFNFWPEGFEISDTQSPIEILEEAKREWLDRSKGQISLAIRNVVTDEGYERYLVYAHHVPSNRVASLFTVVSRNECPYPARLQPKIAELPRFFLKEYWDGPDHDDFRESCWIKNEWVADSPSEFREHLKSILNLSHIKSELLNLISSSRNKSGSEESANYGDAESFDA